MRFRFPAEGQLALSIRALCKNLWKSCAKALQFTIDYAGRIWYLRDGHEILRGVRSSEDRSPEKLMLSEETIPRNPAVKRVHEKWYTKCSYTPSPRSVITYR